MTASPADIFRLVGDIQDDLRRANARFTELRSMLATLNLPDAVEHPCPECPMVFKSPRRLNDHLHVSHLRELEES